MISLGVALRAAKRAYDRDRKTEADDPYRPFDFAARVIRLMFPGTEEHEFEPPTFEYPHVPSRVFKGMKTGPWSGAFAFGPEGYRFRPGQRVVVYRSCLKRNCRN